MELQPQEKKKVKLYVAIPTMGSVVDSQTYILRDIIETYKEHIEFHFPVECVRRCFHDFARNKLAEDFIASDCDILWFLDSDITPPKQVLDLIVLHGDKWKLAGLTYPIFMTPPGSTIPEVVYTTYTKNPNTGNLMPGNTPKSGSGFVDGLATGCMFIHREVLEKLKRPYFEFKFKELDRDLSEGEDLGFCRKVSELGYQFYVDFSLNCRHQKSVDLFDVNNYAIQYANRAVQAYDAVIQKQVVEAIKSAYEKGFKAALKQEQKQAIITPGSTNWNKFNNVIR